VIADGTADPCAVAAELLAQAEHDPDAVPLLISLDGDLPDRVEAELRRQLEGLPTAPVARQALANAGVMPVTSADEAAAASDAIAPEHVTLMVADADALASRLTSYGTLVMGARGSVVFGDYGAGPNHVLPTAGAARWAGGLSVLTFLRVRTWLRLDDGAGTGALAEDAAWLARQEGLEAHARAAEARASSSRRRASS
jgi:phosphoribosyl-ATP pyrophosphohydrolase/phosphoribosyl-AMP cyclohydrolase/histidinol dehydrogenase